MREKEREKERERDRERERERVYKWPSLDSKVCAEWLVSIDMSFAAASIESTALR